MQYSLPYRVLAGVLISTMSCSPLKQDSAVKADQSVTMDSQGNKHYLVYDLDSGGDTCLYKYSVGPNEQDLLDKALSQESTPAEKKAALVKLEAISAKRVKFAALRQSLEKLDTSPTAADMEAKSAARPEDYIKLLKDLEQKSPQNLKLDGGLTIGIIVGVAALYTLYKGTQDANEIRKKLDKKRNQGEPQPDVQPDSTLGKEEKNHQDWQKDPTFNLQEATESPKPMSESIDADAFNRYIDAFADPKNQNPSTTCLPIMEFLGN